MLARSQTQADDFRFEAARADAALAEELGASPAAQQQLAQRLQRAQQAQKALQQPAASNTQRERQLRDHLRSIERAERSGQWISPPGHSAFDALREAQSLAPRDARVKAAAARLLPASEVEDEEDLALLEARDLLFARLLQYRAFKDVAAVFEDRLTHEARRFPRAVGLEERYATLLPEVLIGLGLDEFASLAATAMTPKPVPEVSFAHLHAPQVSVREQGALVMTRLRQQGTMTFRAVSPIT